MSRQSVDPVEMSTPAEKSVTVKPSVLQRLTDDGIDVAELSTDLSDCPDYLRSALNADHRDLWARITNADARRRLITQAENETARRQRRLERDKLRQDAVGAYIDALCRIVDVPAEGKPAAHAELQRLRDEWSEIRKAR